MSRVYREVKGHFYVYMVRTREYREIVDDNGDKKTEMYWQEQDAILACDMHEVAGKLNRKLDDVGYISKTIQR